MMDVSVAVDIVGEYDKNKPKTTEGTPARFLIEALMICVNKLFSAYSFK
jgi:hypothetical protein